MRCESGGVFQSGRRYLKVLTAVIMNGYIFWNITPRSPLKVNGCFGVTRRLHLQSRRIRQESNQHEASYLLEGREKNKDDSLSA
jgi:hypothetical protein